MGKLKTPLIVSAITLGLLVALELGGRVVIHFIEAKKPSDIPTENMLATNEPLLGFGLKRNFHEKYPQWQVTTNKWGFRDNEDFPREKPQGEYRIFVLGGSTVFGWALDSQHSIPSHLQKLIDEKLAARGSTRIRVINAGIPWYASWHEASLAFFRVMEFSPDWIVVVDGLNDTAMSISSSWTRIDEGFVDAPTKAAAVAKQVEKNPFLSGAMSVSKVFTYLRARALAREQSKTGTFRPDAWSQYLSYMDKLNRLCASLNIRFSMFFQPVMMVDKPLDYYEVVHNGTSTQIAEFAENFRLQYLEGEKRLLERRDLPVVSLKKIFEKHPDPIYLDGLHYNGKGNQMIAQEVFRAMEPRLRQVASSPLS